MQLETWLIGGSGRARTAPYVHRSWCSGVAQYAGSLRASCRPTPSLLGRRERTGCAVLRSSYDGDSRRSGASFCSRSETRDRRFGCADLPRHSQSPAVSDDHYLRRGSPSGNLAARESFMRPERHFGDTGNLCWGGCQGDGRKHGAEAIVDTASSRDLRSSRWLFLPDSSGNPVLTLHFHGANDEGSI